LPQQCVLCDADAGKQPFCDGCFADLPWLPARRCPVCALPTPDGLTCGACLKQPPAFSATHCALAYGFPLDALLHHYKYRQRLGLAAALAHLLQTAAPRPETVDLVIPAPLHPERLQQRGFNQVVELLRPWLPPATAGAYGHAEHPEPATSGRPAVDATHRQRQRDVSVQSGSWRQTGGFGRRCDDHRRHAARDGQVGAQGGCQPCGMLGAGTHIAARRDTARMSKTGRIDRLAEGTQQRQACLQLISTPGTTAPDAPACRSTSNSGPETPLWPPSATSGE
jgi:hypothetical protein